MAPGPAANGISLEPGLFEHHGDTAFFVYGSALYRHRHAIRTMVTRF